jgi:hypothetical protein
LTLALGFFKACHIPTLATNMITLNTIEPDFFYFIASCSGIAAAPLQGLTRQLSLRVCGTILALFVHGHF